MKDSEVRTLIEGALLARERSFCPYSSFAVGAALITAGGKVYTGANIESSSYTPTVCAERVAMQSAVHAGEREFTAIAIVGGKKGESISAPVSPCGVCRQFMAEFCDEDFKIILYDGHEPTVYTLGELFPKSFTKKDLGR